ncbi:sigma-70 family RNA polymerase sigma factor [Pararhodobacter aggregans]|uniref:sigma-70 family RNA polymerase sigma factor n=1 Tax=Pararhodobacter aggregans TaxID=404875 RepID=UPI003A9175A0
MELARKRAEECTDGAVGAGAGARIESPFAPDSELASRQISRGKVERLTIRELFGLVEGKVDTVSALIAQGRIHAIDSKGDTALHICAAQGRLQFCDMLIKAGADPSIRNFDARRPDDRAAENNHVLVAALLGSLLPVESLDTPDALPIEPPARVDELAGDAERNDGVPEEFPELGIDDFDLDFEAAEDAEDFHERTHRETHVAAFEAVAERVRRFGDDDGFELDLDDIDVYGLRIQADDFAASTPETADFADAATVRSFLDVRMGPKPASWNSTPVTRFHAVDLAAVRRWVEEVIERGHCEEEDADLLVGSMRGSFDGDAVRGNLFHELEPLGLVPGDDTLGGFDTLATNLPDPDDLLESVVAYCSGTNMRPGVALDSLSAPEEARLFRELETARREICQVLVDDPALVSEVILIGERIEAREVGFARLTELDIQKSRQTPDAEVLSSALSYLVGYWTVLEEGDLASEDRNHAFNAVMSMKLSSAAMEQVANGLSGLTGAGEAGSRFLATLKVWESHRNHILLKHLALVRRLAYARMQDGDDVEDLFQDGVIGLMRALEAFDPERGYRFATYGQFGVRQAIARARDEFGGLIRVPAQRAAVLGKLDDIEGRIAERMPAEAMIALLSEALNLPTDVVREFRRIPRRAVEFDELPPEGLDVDSPQYRDHLAHQREEIITDLLAAMPERTADILARRYGLRGEDEMTLEELGEIYGVTRERIRQVEARQLAALAHPSRVKLLRNLL